jgi:tetratricopeptide (TPR) repeat protein
MIHIERGEGEPAIAELNVAIRIDPKRLDAYGTLASVYMMKSDHAKALEVLDHAVEADSQSGDARAMRAAYFLSHGKPDKALADLDEAVRLNPASPNHLRARARVWFERGAFAQTLADLSAVIKLEPADVEAQQGIAWILATCPDPKIRNGPQAVISATRACELTEWKVAHGLTTLAAAYSETGDFAAAAQWQERALALAADNSPEKREYQRLLDRYKAGKPYHRLSVLEEMGRHNPRVAGKPGD